MNEPFFSVIIPVYNVKKYLLKSVHSVLDQSFSDFEIILIDDGSTDGSDELCDTLKNSDNRIKVIHKKNEGVAVARNTGIRLAQGKYVLFLDSDDSFTQKLLENIHLKVLENNDDIVVFGYRRITETGTLLKESAPPNGCTLEFYLSTINDLPFLLWAKAYKKSLFSNVDLDVIYGITFSEDSYLALALQRQAQSTGFIYQIGYNYLCRSSSVTQNMTEKNHLDRLKAVQLMDALYQSGDEKPPILNEIKFNTKFFYINPNSSYANGHFFRNCKTWRKTFPESSSYKSSELTTAKMKLYVWLIRMHLDIFASVLYYLKQRK